MNDLEFELENQIIIAQFGSTTKEVLEHLNYALTSDIIGVMANFQLKSLNEPLTSNGQLRLVRLHTSIGHKMYRRSLCFLLAKVLRKLYPNLITRISHSLGAAYLFRLILKDDPNLDQELIQCELENEVQKNQNINFHLLTYAEAKKRLENSGKTDQILLLAQKNNREVAAYESEGFWELAHFPLAHQTGILSVFRVELTEDVLLLHFPEKTYPLQMGSLKPQPKFNNIFKEYQRWADILGVPTVARLNQIASTSEVQEFIQVSETLHEKKLSNLADQIVQNENLRLILISGPSSAGKTTFTKKLAIHLRTVGLRPQIIGLDDYFVSREETPLGEDGLPDFECLHALDIPLLNQHLLQLLNGEEAELPIFDFKLGHRKNQRRKLNLGSKEVLLMEGIHALNDELTHLVPRVHKFKIYISALTQLSLDNNFRISTTDNRLIRRMVRDYQFRGYSALHTLRMWPSVRRGEDKNIFPFQETADAVFNSALDYEISVLKNYVLPLLKQVPSDDPQSTHALRLLDFLENFIPIPSQYVPPYSILREFIGQSGFRY